MWRIKRKKGGDLFLYPEEFRKERYYITKQMLGNKERVLRKECSNVLSILRKEVMKPT